MVREGEGLDYGAARARLDRSWIPEHVGSWIGGEHRVGDNATAVIAPSDGSVLATRHDASMRDLDDAIGAARSGLEAWRRAGPFERTRVLLRVAAGLRARADAFAAVEAVNVGKPIRLARSVEVPLAAAHFEYHAGWADKLEYATRGDAMPVGIWAQIVPWNFPLLLAAWKIAPALAAGNAVVMKPAESTPLTLHMLMDVLREAGLPDGVVNVVNGGAGLGAALVSHAGVDGVSFTGSTVVGKTVRRATAGSGKRLMLELGGNGASIVHDDAPMDQAVEGVVLGAFANQGQICCAPRRVLVQENVAEAFAAHLVQRMARLRVGDPLDRNTDVGPVHGVAHLEALRVTVEEAVGRGAVAHVHPSALPSEGSWMAPTILTNVTGALRVAREEVFGPVLTLSTFRTPEEAVALANDTRFGLSASVWTTNGARAQWTAERVRAGVVWINGANRMSPSSPFGGVRESGFGREGGLHGLLDYVDVDGGDATGGSSRQGRAGEGEQ
jgi:aldehyde dehydrogenase (NAD+)